MVIQTKDYSGNNQSFKDVDTKKRQVVGYFASFDFYDSDKEAIQKGAFKKSIAENGVNGTGRIKHLQDHDPLMVVGKLLELKEDNFGLYYESKIGNHTKGNDYLAMVEDGIITEHSIGYLEVNPKVTKIQTKDGHILTELKLYEGSGLQKLASNRFTPILGIKSEQDIEQLFQTLTKAMKSGTYSDETFKSIIEPAYIELQEAIKLTKSDFSTLSKKSTLELVLDELKK